MSNSLDSFLTRIGDVTIERVTPKAGSRSKDSGGGHNDPSMMASVSNPNSQSVNDGDSEETGGETSDGEQEKKHRLMDPEDIEEIHSEGSGDDMDLDDTIDTEIGVRMDSERQHSDSSCQDDDVDGINILDTLPLEGAPIEGQEVTEADLLGKPLLKDDDGESLDDNENIPSETQSGDEENTGKRRADTSESDLLKKKLRKDEGDDSECELKSEKKLANMRRNIREVMDEAQLDEATLAAQRQEAERLRRVQEQQKIIREVQRQIAINRQNSKTQTRVISLLQGKQCDNVSSTSITQSPSSSSTQVKLPSTVLLKVNSATGAETQMPQGAQAGQVPRRPIEGMRWQKGRGGYQTMQTSISRVPNRPTVTNHNILQQRIRMMTPSVSISPVVPKKEHVEKSEYYSDSDMSDEAEIDDVIYEKPIRKVANALKPPKPTKGKDVVTISSSSESSDDDCIVLSDPSGDEEIDNDDDPSNSGMHTNDRYNVPDEHGRVLVNVGHPDTEPDVYLAPQVARIIKPHQIGGVRFLYDNIVESIERYKTSSGFGCILAHSMGLGKTLQVASFCDIFFRSTPAKTVLCIMPINTLQNWLAEFNMWLPYQSIDAVKAANQTGNLKSESSMTDIKSELKEENSNHTDISSSMSSRSMSTDSAHRSSQENTSQLPSISANPFGQQSYENSNTIPNFYPDGMMNKNLMDPNAHMHQGYQAGLPTNPMFNLNMGHGDFKQMKQEVDCGDMNTKSVGTSYTSDGRSAGMQPGQLDSRSQAPLFPATDNRTSMYPLINNQVPGYSGYPNLPDQVYGNNPSHMMQSQPEIKTEHSFERTSEATIKQEPSDSGPKDEASVSDNNDTNAEKKPAKAATPYSVDAPIGVELRPRHFQLHILNDSHKTMTARAKVINDWQKFGGVLLIGYELYRQLSLKKPNKGKRKRGQPFKDTVDVEEDDKNKTLLDDMHGALVNPGPDLVICDEGHRIKNSHASISVALKQMRTKRRIVLTGYPLQNNLLEYWCMVDFVRPNYLGTKSEFCNMFERPIQNGQCIDSTPQDIRLMRYRAHVLHALLEGFVQRRSHSVLQISLPRKEEYILLVRMTPHQRKLYDTFMNQVVKTRAVPNPLKAFAVCCKIWNHPDILFHFLRKRQANEEDDLDLEETIAEKGTPGGKRSKARQPKGESKKGKKLSAAVKAKPAASVQPNSSSSTSTTPVATAAADVTEGDTTHVDVKGNFPNYPPQIANPNFPVTGQQQNTYPQGYQNYRGSDQNYYRNDQPANEYNEYYNNSGQQRYPNQSQSFQSFPQNDLGYGTTQSYPQNQNQSTYPSAADANANNTQKYSQPTNTEFRADQATSNSYDMTAIYPQQPYGFQEQGRNYPPNVNSGVNQSFAQNSNTPGNYSNQMPNQSASVSMPDYSAYGQAQNQSQNYPTSAANNSQQMYSRTDNQSVANSSMSYANPPNQTNSSLMPGPGANYPPGRPNQPPVSIQNSSGNGNNQIPTNHPNQGPALYPPNQSQSNAIVGNSPHGYMTNQASSQPPMPQNQIRGYQPSQQNPYSTQQTPASYPVAQSAGPPAQGHSYLSETQSPASGKHGNYPPNHLVAGTSSQSCQPTPNAVNQSHNYSQNQQPPMQSRYSSASQNPSSVQQNQSGPFPPGSQQRNSGPVMGQSEQVSGMSANYPINQNQQQNTGMSNYTGDPGNQSQYKNQDGQYHPSSWQGNYSQPVRSQDQCNDQYFMESGNNRYQGNYMPRQNYVQNSSYDYGHNPDMKNENKTVQPGMMARGQVNYEKSTKDAGTSVGMHAQQSRQQNNMLNTPNYAGNNVAKSMQNMSSCHGINNRVNPVDMSRDEDKDKDEIVVEKEKEDKSDEEILTKDEEKDLKNSPNGREEPGIPYDWATELMKGYVPGLIDASAKMTLFFCILEEAIGMGDRVLAFSQSLFTLNLIEDFLARNDIKYPDGKSDAWIKNVNYYRLDGSTSALEREKLINEFNSNPKIHLFLVSTRAGSLGINLVGANRAIVFDASWNPCHDTQAVCRVYRYGQRKPCYVYRLVTDNCLERKIYDRQISKQGMADRVVDQCNPDAHLSLKEATTLSWDWEEDGQVQDFSSMKDNYTDEIMQLVLERHSSLLTKQPFHHESLLVDRKDKKLSQAEKRLARRGYELEKMAANCSKPSYNYVPGNTATRAGGLQIRAIRGGPSDTGVAPKPVASVRPMQQRGGEGIGGRGIVGSRWIPAEVWQRQGMSAQEMTLPLDVVIPTNSPDKSSIVLKAGQRVMVLKSPKGIYMQLESGKIIAIRTALKINQQKREEEPKKAATSAAPRNPKPEVSFPLRNNSAISIIPKASTAPTPTPRLLSRPGSAGFKLEKDSPKRPRAIPTPIAKQMMNPMGLSHQVSLQRLSKGRSESVDHSSVGENSNSSDSQPRTDQRVEEVRLEDIVAEAGSNPEYSPANSNRTINSDTEHGLKRVAEGKGQDYAANSISTEKSGQTVTPQQSIDIEQEIRSKDARSSHASPSAEGDRSMQNIYMHRYPSQAPKEDHVRDEIIIEEPPASAIAHSQKSQPQESLTRRQSQPYTQRPPEIVKHASESINSTLQPPSTEVNVPPKDRAHEQQEHDVQAAESHGIPQAYPYTQFPRYYDYADPRSRGISSPYGSYFPDVPSHSTSPQTAEPTKPKPDAGKSPEERMTASMPAYSQPPIVPPPPANPIENKNPEITPTTLAPPTPDRGESHLSTAFSHPASGRYTGSYPPGPYDPYAQHYPTAPNSTPTYPPGGAPGYAAYGGPSYNADYARVYSAFHGPPPAADPYMHRGYAPPPATHPSNPYYAPFPHPPPPYPNYSFLPPYPNPNMPNESQPPAQ